MLLKKKIVFIYKGKNVNRQDGQDSKMYLTSIVVTRLLSIIMLYQYFHILSLIATILSRRALTITFSEIVKGLITVVVIGVLKLQNS